MTELQYLQNTFYLAFLFLEVVIIPLTNSPSCLSITFKHNFIENVYDKKLYDGFNSHLAALAIPGLLLILHAPKAFNFPITGFITIYSGMPIMSILVLLLDSIIHCMVLIIVPFFGCSFFSSPESSMCSWETPCMDTK